MGSTGQNPRTAGGEAVSLSSYTNEELLSLHKSKSQDMMYYQCAEGESWYRERLARESCKAELAMIAEEIYARGLDIPKVSYIL